MKRRGSVLLAALSIVGILCMWAVAAVHRVNTQTGAIRHGYRKSELYYLCKQASGRALEQMNRDPHWIGRHSSQAEADRSTPGTLCWAEAMPDRPDRLLLRCQAQVGQSRDEMSVPVLTDADSSSRIYSVARGRAGGDFVAWTSQQKDGWESLPPLPGAASIESVAATPDGDIYVIAGGQGQALWRYRRGRGWVRCPDAPGKVQISRLAACGNDRLLCLGSDNSLLIFPLREDAMHWQAVEAPPGMKLTGLASSPNPLPFQCATALSEGGPVLLRYTGESGWERYPTPDQVVYNRQSGLSSHPGQSVADFSGGVALDPDGRLLLASNTPSSAAVIYAFNPESPGSIRGNWKPLPPLREVAWQAGDARTAAGYASRIDHLRTDERGGLWAQLSNLSGTQFSNIYVAEPPK